MSFWRSKITDELVKKATDGYIKATSIPTIVSGRFEPKTNNDVNNGIIKSIWSQKSPEIGKSRQFARIFRYVWFHIILSQYSGISIFGHMHFNKRIFNTN